MLETLKHLINMCIFSTSNGLYYSELNNLNQIKAIIEPDNFFNNDYTTLFKFENIIYTSCVINFDFKKIKNNQDIVFVFPFKYLSAINSSKCYVSDVTNNVLLYDISKQKIIDTIFKPDDYRISVHHLLYYNNKLFISTSKGLYVYNNNKDKTIYLSGKEVQKVEITEQQVYILSEDKIYNYPQLQIVFNGEAYQVITIKDVLKWHQNYFIASEEGLVLVDNQWKAVYHYGRKNGLISNVINDIYAIDSTLILATDKGVSFTQMKNLFTHYPEITTPSLQFIVTNNDTIYWKNQKQLSFNTLTHDIYFYILCSNFNPLTKVKYQYKLNESEWINFDNSPLHFSSLSGGNYVLQIRATTDEKHFYRTTHN
ncbi:MAG: hypothetical protein KatS3mg027_2055 [Bacteroidia bacterium]|nr:MAG: hypothetical protein KatS3mg027_2055 [Bacteroidia bacterium]